MCQFINDIRDVVNKFVHDKREFTAYEVSQEVQRRVASRGETPIGHAIMRDDVHDSLRMHLSRGYKREFEWNSAAAADVWMYKPVLNKVKDFAQMSIGKNTLSPPVGVTDIFTLKFDKRGGIRIPSQLVKRAKLNSKNYVFANGGRLIVKSTFDHDSAQEKFVTSYSLTNDKGLRPRASTLKRANLDKSHRDIVMAGISNDNIVLW